MKKFILNILSFGFLVFILAYTYDFVVTEGLKKSEYAEFNDWNKILTGSIKSDIIISGSSKAKVQILPNILDSVLNTNSYNLAANGYGFNMQKAKFDAYAVKNNYPKALIQVVSNKTMQKRDDLFEMDQFLPYLDNAHIKNVTKEYLGLKPYDYALPLTRYFGKYYLQYVGFVSYFNLPFNVLKDPKNKGAIAYDKSWDGSFEKFTKQNPDGVTYNIDYSSHIKFKSYIQNLENNNVIIFLVYPPVYYKSKAYILNRDEIIDYYKSISTDKKNVFYMDYSNSKLSYDKINFYNSQHLNKKGATEFSKVLAKDIANYLSELNSRVQTSKN